MKSNWGRNLGVVQCMMVYAFKETCEDCFRVWKKHKYEENYGEPLLKGADREGVTEWREAIGEYYLLG